MRTQLRWAVVLLVMLAIAPVSAMALDPILDPNVPSGTLIVNGQELGFYRAAANLANSPDYNWTYGCSPTSAGMMMGYYDRNGYLGKSYANLVPGGVAELNTFGPGPYLVNNAIASPGHIADFYKTPPGYLGSGDDSAQPWHTFNCLADFMGSSQDSTGNSNGSTTFYYWTNGAPFTAADAANYGVQDMDGMYGMGEYVTYSGYSTKKLYTQLIDARASLGFTFNQYKAEIDAGRPMLIQVEGHTMFGYGYTDPNIITLYDTWAPNGQNPGTMTWGGSYSNMAQWGVVAMEITPEPASLSLLVLGGLGMLLRRRK
jgi:hypothetical protein